MVKIIYLSFLTLVYTLNPVLLVSQNVNITRSSFGSTVTVKIVDNPLNADLIVFFTENRYAATGNTGIWSISRRREVNRIFITNQHNADLNIYITDNRHRARWVNRRKMHLIQ
jgi:hypothetical protein